LEQALVANLVVHAVAIVTMGLILMAALARRSPTTEGVAQPRDHCRLTHVIPV
jgi:hypothetical protein